MDGLLPVVLALASLVLGIPGFVLSIRPAWHNISFLGGRRKFIGELNNAILEQTRNLRLPPAGGRGVGRRHLDQLLQNDSRELGYTLERDLDKLLLATDQVRTLLPGGNHTTANIYRHSFEPTAQQAVVSMKKKRQELHNHRWWRRSHS